MESWAEFLSINGSRTHQKFLTIRDLGHFSAAQVIYSDDGTYRIRLSDNILSDSGQRIDRRIRRAGSGENPSISGNWIRQSFRLSDSDSIL